MFRTLKKHWQNAQRVWGTSVPLGLKRAELLEAQLALLEAQSAVEYSRCIVKYNDDRIKRLKADIQSDEDENRRIELARREDAMRSPMPDPEFKP